MKKRLITYSLVTLSLLAVSLVGCSGGSDSEDNDSSKEASTGTGYYVDSAVAGVDFLCGTQKGITDTEGKFTFELGQDCHFSVAGIPLRTTKSEALSDGQKVFEDNADVARFLQSIDYDGDVSNGIQIEEGVIAVLRKALEDKTLEAQIPKDEILADVIENISADDEKFKGTMRTKEEVTSHLSETSKSIFKELFAGKTLYTTIYDEMGTLESWTFDKDMTSASWQEIVGGDEKGSHTIIDINENVISLDEHSKLEVKAILTDYIHMEVSFIEDGISHQETLRVYFSEAKARAYLLAEEKKGSTSLENSDVSHDVSNELLKPVLIAFDIEKYFAGQTKYFANTNGGTGVRTYNEDGTYTGIVAGKEVAGSYHFDNGVMTLTNTVDDKTLTFTHSNYAYDAEGFSLEIRKSDSPIISVTTYQYESAEARDKGRVEYMAKH